MSHTYLQSKELYYCRLRVPKDESYFIYFVFESNEGLCYYSTVDDSLKGQYRDLDVKTSIELKQPLLDLITRLQTEIRVDILEESILIDA